MVVWSRWTRVPRCDAAGERLKSGADLQVCEAAESVWDKRVPTAAKDDSLPQGCAKVVEADHRHGSIIDACAAVRRDIRCA